MGRGHVGLELCRQFADDHQVVGVRSSRSDLGRPPSRPVRGAALAFFPTVTSADGTPGSGAETAAATDDDDR